MTQQRPSDPDAKTPPNSTHAGSAPHATDAGTTAASRTPDGTNGSDTPAHAEHGTAGDETPRTVRVVPSHQSRPGPDDDIMLATGKPVSGSSASGRLGSSTQRGGAPGRSQEQIRRQPGRRPWIPNQHGAWSMLVVPAIIGWIVGGVSWKNLLVLPAWWSAYLTYWAWCQWLRTRSPRRRALVLMPLVVYTASTALLAFITVLVCPYLLQFVLPFAPLFAIALWQVWVGHERSLLSGIATTAAASLMAAVTYSLAVGGAGGFLGSHDAAGSGLPGASPNGLLTGWAWMWLVTALTAAYFCGTVPYIKSMIRGRLDNTLLIGMIAWHVLVAAAVVYGAAGGWVSWAHAVVWIALALRAIAIPLWNRFLLHKRRKPLHPRTMGLSEVVFTLAFIVTVAL